MTGFVRRLSTVGLARSARGFLLDFCDFARGDGIKAAGLVVLGTMLEGVGLVLLVPVVAVVPSPLGRSVLHAKMVANIQEVRARGARTIVIAEEGDEAVVPYADELIRVPVVPTLLQPLVSVIPLQVFACELAVARGNNVDRPRTLAKSVTVE